jgi:hypothetical protein
MGYSDSKTDSENSSGPAHYVAEAVQAQCRGARLAVDRLLYAQKVWQYGRFSMLYTERKRSLRILGC